MQALSKGEITVLGGEQTRPNIHIEDVTDLYLFLLEKEIPGIFNAGFENISILDIAKLVSEVIHSKIMVLPSNDPRSYRLNSDKLMNIGFKPKRSVQHAIHELIDKFNKKTLVDRDTCYNIRTMKQLAL